ncbi:MAG: hypothetical protein KTR28_07760 [Micavibrio sp.]|nr:hypothetical protein [Micavibrio sp.]
MYRETLDKIFNGRSIVIDLEMTGIPLSDDHRVVSVGLVEMFEGEKIGETKEFFVKPECPNGEGVVDIHGLSDEFLAEQPLFAEQVKEMLEFIGDSPLVHHCWYGQNGHSVDEDFFEMELVRAGEDVIAHERWINMKKWAQVLDAEKNSLNTLLDRYGVDKGERDGKKGHGALSDALLTAKVFPMTVKSYSEKAGDIYIEPPHKPLY